MNEWAFGVLATCWCAVKSADWRMPKVTFIPTWALPVGLKVSAGWLVEVA